MLNRKATLLSLKAATPGSFCDTLQETVSAFETEAGKYLFSPTEGAGPGPLRLLSPPRVFLFNNISGHRIYF